MTALPDLRCYTETIKKKKIMKAEESSEDEKGMETQREQEDGDFRGNKVEQEGKQGMNEVSIELKRSLSLELHRCKKYCMGLIHWIIIKDARSYPMPNGKKPKNHVTVTETTSLWMIFSVINDCKPQSISSLGVTDADIKMWDQSSQVSAYFIWTFHIQETQERHFFGIWEYLDSNKYKATNFKFTLSTLWPSLLTRLAAVCFSLENRSMCIWLTTHLKQLKAGGNYQSLCYCSAISCWFRKHKNTNDSTTLAVRGFPLLRHWMQGHSTYRPLHASVVVISAGTWAN